MRLIRDLLAHITALTLFLRHHAPHGDLPDPPQIPAELQEEI
ncbi:hypothetical protein [Rhodococcus sp. O3]